MKWGIFGVGMLSASSFCVFFAELLQIGSSWPHLRY